MTGGRAGLEFGERRGDRVLSPGDMAPPGERHYRLPAAAIPSCLLYVSQVLMRRPQTEAGSCVRQAE